MEIKPTALRITAICWSQGIPTLAAVAGVAGCAFAPPPGAVLGRPGYCSVVSGDEYGSSSLSLTPRGPAVQKGAICFSRKFVLQCIRSPSARQNDQTCMGKHSKVC